MSFMEFYVLSFKDSYWVSKKQRNVILGHCSNDTNANDGNSTPGPQVT